MESDQIPLHSDRFPPKLESVVVGDRVGAVWLVEYDSRTAAMSPFPGDVRQNFSADLFFRSIFLRWIYRFHTDSYVILNIVCKFFLVYLSTHNFIVVESETTMSIAQSSSSLRSVSKGGVLQPGVPVTAFYGPKLPDVSPGRKNRSRTEIRGVVLSSHSENNWLVHWLPVGKNAFAPFGKLKVVEGATPPRFQGSSSVRC